MNSPLKTITIWFILISFLAVIFLSLPTMLHGANGHETNNSCLFPGSSQALCPTNTLVAIFHHIASYQSFLNVPVGFSLTALITIWLLLVSLALVFFLKLNPPPDRKLLLVSRLINLHDNFPQQQKIRRWLALFENSPSFI